MKIILNNEFESHDVQAEIHHGKMVPSFENPSRLKHILACFKDNADHAFIAPHDYGVDPILRVHDAAYIAFLQNIWTDWIKEGNEGDITPYIWPAPGLGRMAHENLNAKVGSFAFSSDTAIMAGTWAAAYQGAQCALSAYDQVKGGERAAFALTRPPGHHAHAGLYGGYCFLNNAAIVAQRALYLGAKRVAVLDVDYHHGNGTQDIFYRRDDVLTISIHGHPKSNFPYFLGYEEEIGDAGGQGYNLNLALADGADFTVWSQAFEKARAKLSEFSPELLVVPLGVDTFEGDPISKFKLKTQDFREMGKMLASLNYPCVFVMEGGYDIAPLGQNVFNVIDGFDQAVG